MAVQRRALILLAAALALPLGRAFATTAGIYLALNLAYSLGLKRLVLINSIAVEAAGVARTAFASGVQIVPPVPRATIWPIVPETVQPEPPAMVW